MDSPLKREWGFDGAPGNEAVKIKRVEVIPEYLDDTNNIDIRVPVNVIVEIWNLRPQLLNVSIQLYNTKGDCIMALGSSAVQLQNGTATAHLRIPAHFLNDDSYYLSVVIVKDKAAGIYILEDAIGFTVEDYRADTAWFGKWAGAVRPTFLPFTLTQTN
jgi:lipopolysaccharide transport system ATP-binding protein